MSCNAMLQALNLLMDLDTLQQVVGENDD